mmetsp:Transcript_25989/g.87358  ORF Transcript_25989/g.87358 Transcript_25989/m.87358 type:complete len:122 (+) Transcript_25989:262-627(+)
MADGTPTKAPRSPAASTPQSPLVKFLGTFCMGDSAVPPEELVAGFSSEADIEANFEAMHRRRMEEKERRQSLMNDVGPYVCENTAAITAGFNSQEEEDAVLEQIHAARALDRKTRAASFSE